MIRPKDIELEIEEGERYLDASQFDLAAAKFRMALSLLGRLAKLARVAGKVGGPLAGITVAEIVDSLMDGLDSPWLNVIIGGTLGYAGGVRAARVVEDAMSPLWVRIYQGLGDVAHRQGDDVGARKFYSTALQLRPDDPVLMQRMATVT